MQVSFVAIKVLITWISIMSCLSVSYQLKIIMTNTSFTRSKTEGEHRPMDLNLVGCLVSKKSSNLCFFLHRGTNSHSAFCEVLDKTGYFWDCFPCARCCDCTSLLFSENQTKIALQLILLFQAYYPDTLKVTKANKKIYSVAVALLTESSLAPEEVPRLLSAPKSRTWHSSCSFLRH